MNFIIELPNLQLILLCSYGLVFLLILPQGGDASSSKGKGPPRPGGTPYCKYRCPERVSPLCGENGLMYRNECSMACHGVNAARDLDDCKTKEQKQKEKEEKRKRLEKEMEDEEEEEETQEEKQKKEEKKKKDEEEAKRKEEVKKKQEEEERKSEEKKRKALKKQLEKKKKDAKKKKLEKDMEEDYAEEVEGSKPGQEFRKQSSRFGFK